MSYRIVYDLAATRFSADTLNAAFPDHGFSSDQYLFFELGGDNNLYESYASRQRTLQRRVRNWSLIAMGSEWEVMRQLVTFAASCEGGGMRFSGASETAAETYIRKCRTIPAHCRDPMRSDYALSYPRNPAPRFLRSLMREDPEASHQIRPSAPRRER